MKFDWVGYLDLAEELLHEAGRPSEALRHDALLRSISRSYYAAFGSCRGYWRHSQPADPLPDHGTVHFEVRDRFGRYPDPRFADISHKLDNLLKWRRLADYEDEVPRLEQLAAAASRYANRVVNQLLTLDSDPP